MPDLPRLPEELLQKVCQYLDLESVVYFSQANRQFFEAPGLEEVCKFKLQATCPWFEPQNSHRQTWRECAAEYVRRRKGGRFVPALTVSRASDSKEESDQLDSQLVKDLPICDYPVVRPELAGLHSKKRYTSEHGISMDLSHVDFDVDDEFDNVISRPDMLVLDICKYMGCCWREYCILVKYKDSKGTKADLELNDVGAPEKPQMYELDNHPFLLTVDQGACAFEEHPNLNEHPNESKLYYFDKKGIHEIELGKNYVPVMAVYDGLFHVLNDNKYYCLQCSLDEPAIVDCVQSPLSAAKSVRKDTWDPYKSVVRDGDQLYMWNVSTNVLREHSFASEDRKHTYELEDGDLLHTLGELSMDDYQHYD